MKKYGREKERRKKEERKNTSENNGIPSSVWRTQHGRTNKEISIWRNKVRQTHSDILHFQEQNEILKVKTSESDLKEVSNEVYVEYDTALDNGKNVAEVGNETLSNNMEKVLATTLNENDANSSSPMQATKRNFRSCKTSKPLGRKKNSKVDKSESSFDIEALAHVEENIVSPSVNEVFDYVKAYEAVCENLPVVPADNDLDKDIESKLNDLKTFNQFFLYNGKTEEEMSDEVNDRFEDIKTKVVTVNRKAKEVTIDDATETKNFEALVTPQTCEDLITPVYSTPEDVHNFNAWYYEQLEKKSTKPKFQNLKETDDSYRSVYKSKTESCSEGFEIGGKSRTACWSGLQSSGIDQKGCLNSSTKTKSAAPSVGELYDNLSPYTVGHVDEELYKQLNVSSEVPANNCSSNGLSSVLMYLQAYFILTVMLCKSYHEKMVEVANNSQFQLLPTSSTRRSHSKYSPTKSTTSSSAARCSCPCRGCEGSSCMCMVFRRAMGKLGYVGFVVKNIGVDVKETAKERMRGTTAIVLMSIGLITRGLASKARAVGNMIGDVGDKATHLAEKVKPQVINLESESI